MNSETSLYVYIAEESENDANVTVTLDAARRDDQRLTQM